MDVYNHWDDKQYSYEFSILYLDSLGIWAKFGQAMQAFTFQIKGLWHVGLGGTCIEEYLTTSAIQPISWSKPMSSNGKSLFSLDFCVPSHFCLYQICGT